MWCLTRKACVCIFCKREEIGHHAYIYYHCNKKKRLINEPCTMALVWSFLVIALILSNPRCAGGCGYLSEQADQGGSRPEAVCELSSAAATPPGLQNSVLSAQVWKNNPLDWPTILSFSHCLTWFVNLTLQQTWLMDTVKPKRKFVFKKRDLAAFKILIKNRAEIGPCCLLVFTDYDPTNYE